MSSTLYFDAMPQQHHRASYADNSLRALANRLARAVASEDAAIALRELSLSGALSSQPDAGRARGAAGQAQSLSSPRDDSRRVGIWERDPGSNHFLRRTDEFDEWSLWANVSRIPVKRTKRRVALIGESAARGYLFDPQFTPAKALESILVSQLGPGEVDVVDLARTGLLLTQMKTLAREALGLKPDVVVIFAGNNWFGAGFRSEGTPELAAAVRESGVAGLKRVMESNHKESVRNAVREIRDLYEANGTSLIWIAPEFNLGDWRDPETNAPCLADGRNEEWMSHWLEAREALSRGDFEKASRHAGRMVELDSGTCPTGYYILAECERKTGELDVARSRLEQARDTLIWSPFVKTPRLYRATRETLREEAVKGGGDLVDLPEIFRAYAGEIPDRRLFLDYCHLSAEGIRVAMAAAASRALWRFTGVAPEWRELVGRSAGPSRQVEAETMFLAAVYNALLSQPYELIRHFCRRALELSPALADVMSHLIDIQTRRAPELMCKSAEKIAELPSPSIRQHLLRWEYLQFDKVLPDAIVDSLAEIGVDRKTQLDSLRIEERSAARRSVDLVDPYYALSAEQPGLAQPGNVVETALASVRADYYKAYAPESKFVFVGESGKALSLALTCRLPSGAAEGGSITVELNGCGKIEAPIGPEWQSWEIAAPAGAVKDGINEVVVRWPRPRFGGRKQLEAAADDLLADIFPEFYPVFGEIHLFTVEAARA